MNELSLFTGSGGGVLGGKLLGWNTVGYVEFNEYCQRVLRQRIDDGIFDEAPIFGDINHFIESGCAEQYRRFVNVVSAGFPCQPFSQAGRGGGSNDPRNKWEETLKVARLVEPDILFLENVPGLVNHKSRYFGHILGSLSENGFDARWTIMGAKDTGALHRRNRLWIVAYPRGKGLQGYEQARDHPEASSGRQEGADGSVTQRRDDDPNHLAYSEGERHGGRSSQERPAPERVLQSSQQEGREMGGEVEGRSGIPTGALGPWSVEPPVGRVADGVSDRKHRLTALGNAQVPIVAANAFRTLTQSLGEL